MIYKVAYFLSILIAFPICFIMQFGGYVIIIREQIGELPLVILILYYAALLFAIGFLIIPLILYFYIYGDITTQLIEWASMLKDFMSSLINTETKLDKVKKYMAALNHITGM